MSRDPPPAPSSRVMTAGERVERYVKVLLRFSLSFFFFFVRSLTVRGWRISETGFFFQFFGGLSRLDSSNGVESHPEGRRVCLGCCMLELLYRLRAGSSRCVSNVRASPPSNNTLYNMYHQTVDLYKY